MTEAIAEPVASEETVNAGTDQERFILRSRLEIVYILRELVRAQGLATIQFGSEQDALLAPLLTVDTGHGELIFDCSNAEAVNARVLQAAKLLFLSAQDKVQIRFSTSAARLTAQNGRKAFAVPLPQDVLRLQRRDYYRVVAPVMRPVKCIFAIEAQGGYRYVETRLHDISEGGVAIIAQPGELPAQFGACLANTRILLPEVGNVIVTLEIRNTACVTMSHDKNMQRIGCQFVRPSTAAITLIKRYMMKLERERKVRE